MKGLRYWLPALSLSTSSSLTYYFRPCLLLPYLHSFYFSPLATRPSRQTAASKSNATPVDPLILCTGHRPPDLAHLHRSGRVLIRPDRVSGLVSIPYSAILSSHPEHTHITTY